MPISIDKRVWLALAVALLLVAPLGLYPLFLAKVLCFALFASAFNLLLGYGGLLSFGHAAFFGFSAYVAAHVTKEWGFNPEFAILAGTGTGLILGVVFGCVAIRRQGIYFAMVTLALAQMIYFISVQAPFTHGEDGIQGVPRRDLFGLIDISSNIAIYYLTLVIFLAGILLIYRTIHSPFGQILQAIRENEPRAISLGYDTDRYKLLTFVISATVAGLAGSTKVLVFQLASLNDVNWHVSGEVVLMTLLGGMGTLLGPILGSAVLVTMQNYLAQMGSLTTIIQGVIFITCVLLFRRGIVGEIQAYLDRRKARQSSEQSRDRTSDPSPDQSANQP